MSIADNHLVPVPDYKVDAAEFLILAVCGQSGPLGDYFLQMIQ